MEIKITPLYDRVLLRPHEQSQTASGIYVPQSSQERSQIMKVLGIGSGCKNEAVTLNVGDTVLVSKYAGTEITAACGKLFIMKQCEILAKLEEKELGKTQNNPT